MLLLVAFKLYASCQCMLPRQSRYYFREKNFIQQAGNVVFVLGDSRLLSGFEQGRSQPWAQGFNIIFWMMTEACLPLKCGILY